MSSQLHPHGGTTTAAPARRAAGGPVTARFAGASLRLAMAAAARLHPGLAAWAMDRLWFRAPRTRPQGAALASLTAGRRVDFLLDGKPVAAWEWGEQGPCVLLVHGWGGHGGQLHAFVQPLLRAGMRVVAFDAPAHGASGPSRHGRRRVTFFQFADAVQALQARHGPLAGVIAHSGGCTALGLALRRGWQAPARCVFVAPFCEPAAAVEGFARQLGADRVATARFAARVVGWLGIEWHDLDLAGVPVAKRPEALLVLHDEGDREVPLAQSRRLAEAWPGTRLVVTREAGHRRILAREDVVQEAVSFIAQGRAPRSRPADPRPADARCELDQAYAATERFWRRA